MSITFQKPSLIASVLAVAGVLVLCSLGTWQAKKYVAKQYHGDCEATEESCQNKTINKTKGRFLSSPIIAVQPRVHEGIMGFHIYALFQEEVSESSYFVNLGWSKEHKPEFDDNKQVSLKGRFVPASGKNIFTPQSNPEKNEWYGFDFEDVNGHFPELYTQYTWKDDQVLFAQEAFYTEENASVLKPFVPAELSKTYLQPETHLQYAAFWFFMALALGVIFVLRFVVVTKKAS